MTLQIFVAGYRCKDEQMRDEAEANRRIAKLQTMFSNVTVIKVA